MRPTFYLLTVMLMVAGCNTEPVPERPVAVQPGQPQGDAASIDSEYSSAWHDNHQTMQGDPDSQCHPALEPLRQTVPSANQIEGQPLKSQTCGVNLVTKVYGPLDDSAPGATIFYSIHSYTRQYADLTGFTPQDADAFLAQQRQGWLVFLENLREKVRWAQEPDIYTEAQLARLPQELLWQDSMPAVLDNGTGIWALTIWLTEDIAANVSVHDETNPDPTAEEALQRLTPLANALNFQRL